ncbi:Tetratricopeptide repeat-containing protein [Nitrosospira sp. Nsp14]|uniref:CHAT domain-containing protein n=1 Tax=Nitrosospira sp. Nsp14 TaxID=1855333 RepID=UPI0008E6DB40|nr:CHAT domain-containing tetratricopeptide repeat protein [Nitrosospira sp. Nsp14]SFH58210.1 Tetratricopeptide repeat-containing protein [Nitrosospira sp. Nsp14]
MTLQVRAIGYHLAALLLLGLIPIATRVDSAEISPHSTVPPISDEQRLRLLNWTKELCPPLSEQFAENESTDGQDAAAGSKEMDRAQNLLSEGQTEEVVRILCRVLAMRVQSPGLAHPRTIVVLNAIGVVLRKQGESGRARRLFEDLYSVVYGYPPEGRRLQRIIMHNLGTSLYSQGYMRESEAIFRRALKMSEAVGDDASESVGATLTNLAFALEAQKRYQDAEKLHRRALDIRSVKEGWALLDRAATLNNLGANLTAQERFAEGTPFLEEGLKIRKRLLNTQNLNIGFSLASLSKNLSARGQTNEARILARQLVTLRRSTLGDTHPETAMALELLASVNLESGDYAGALEAARLAMAARLPLSLREETAVSDDARFTSRTALSSAALVTVRANWRASKTSEKFWSNPSAPTNSAEAFLAAQRIPASGTADAFLRSGARSAANNQGMGELALALVQAQDARSAADRDIAEGLSRGVPVEALRTKRAMLERSVLEIESEFRKRFPAFFELARPEPTGIERLSGDAGFLLPNEVLILLEPGTTKNGFVWAISRERGAWAEIPIDAADVQAKVTTLRQQLDLASGYDVKPTSRGLVRSASFDRKLARKLYKDLFGAPQIAAVVDQKSHWILVPQGGFISLPFSTLIAGPISGGAVADADPDVLRTTSWLATTKVLTLLPSVSSLRMRTEKRPTATPDATAFFGLGDPSFKGPVGTPTKEVSNYFDSRSGRADTIRDLAALPGTRMEIEKLADLLGASRDDYLLGDEANETELRHRNALGQLAKAHIVAFATHGLITGELRDSVVEPALALTPPELSDVSDDGLLTASEVAGFTFNADWILLSACNTAAPNSTSTEGLTGLARAFFVAGARSLLVSHWRVRDDVAARITIRAVELSRGSRAMPRAEALRAAMQEVIADRSADASQIAFSHPAIWAPFILVGGE